MHYLLLFDVSGGEFLVIVIFILIFFGSKNIPDLARGLGKGIREFKNAANSIKHEITNSAGIDSKDITNPVKKEIDNIKREVTAPLDQPLDDLNKEINDGLK